MRQRKEILAHSTLDWREFDGWLRKGWLKHFLR